MEISRKYSHVLLRILQNLPKEIQWVGFGELKHSPGNSFQNRGKVSELEIENAAALAKNLMQKGAYAISKHANLRQGERCLTIGDVKILLIQVTTRRKKMSIKTNMQSAIKSER